MTPLSGFIGGAYSLPDKDVACQRCINLFPEKVDTADKSPAILVGTPGQSVHWGTYEPTYGLTTQNPRKGGLFTAANGRMFAIIGTTIYEISPVAWGLGRLGIVVGVGGPLANMTTNGPVAMADNGNGILIVDGVGYWWLDFTTGATSQVVDASLTAGATHIGYLDGRFIINDVGTNVFRCSPLDWDGSATWDPLALASADQSPDNIQGLVVRGRDIVIFGLGNYEIWYDAGTSPFPYARNTPITSDVGAYAPFSIQKLEDTVFWLGSGERSGFGTIYNLLGYQPNRISTFAIEQEIREYGGLENAFGMVYSESGHFFYIITFPAGNKSWCFDLATGEWHQRGWLNPLTGDIEAMRAYAIASFSGRTFVMDPQSRNMVVPITGATRNCTTINELSMTTYTDCDDPILRLRSSPHTYSGMNWVFFSRFALDIQPGVGLSNDQGSDPLVRLRWSNNGGRTWSNFLLRSFGKVGEYAKRIFWARLGRSRNRVWEISTSEPVPVRIAGAWIEAAEGNA